MTRVVWLLTVLLLAPGVAAHAAEWKPAGHITPPGQDSDGLEGSVDASGNALFVIPGSFVGKGVSYRARPSGGPFGPIKSITGSANYGQLAGNARGEAIYAHTDFRTGRPPGGESSRLLVSSRPPGGDFSEPELLFDGGDREAVCGFDPELSATGEAVVILLVAPIKEPAVGRGDCRLYAAVRSAGSASFGAPIPLAGPGSGPVSLALDNRGNGLLAWGYGSTGAIEVARHPAGQGFLPAQTLRVQGESVRDDVNTVDLRVSNRTGRAVLAFASARPNGQPHVAAAVGSTSRGFGEPEVLSGPATFFGSAGGSYFAAGAGDDGTLAVTWRGPRSRSRVKAAVIGPDETKLTAEDTESLSRLRAQAPRLVVTDQGRVTVVWTRYLSRTTRVLEAASADGGDFSRPEQVSHPAGRPPFAIAFETSSRGEQFVAWEEQDEIPGPSALKVAKASGRTGRFGRRLYLAAPRADTLTPYALLFRGANGSMLAALERRSSSDHYWDLRTYGERP